MVKITPETALLLLPSVMALVNKLVAIVTSQDPASIDEEIAGLEAAKLRPSSEIVDEADKAGA